MEVHIIENKSGKLVAKIPIVLKNIGYKPTDQEFYDEAWQCAVNDGTVEAACRDEYYFQLN